MLKRKASGPLRGARNPAKLSRPVPAQVEEIRSAAALVEVTEDVVADIFAKFPNWPKNAVLSHINKSVPLKHLAYRVRTSDPVPKPQQSAAEFKGFRVQAYLVQSRGTPNKIRCTHCRVGNGPFVGTHCISASYNEIRYGTGACGAAQWGGNNHLCDWAAKFNIDRFAATPNLMARYRETARRLAAFPTDPEVDLRNDDDDLDSDSLEVFPGWYRVGPVLMTLEQIRNDLNTVDELIGEIRFRRNGELPNIPSIRLSTDNFIRYGVEKKWYASELLQNLPESDGSFVPGTEKVVQDDIYEGLSNKEIISFDLE